MPVQVQLTEAILLYHPGTEETAKEEGDAGCVYETVVGIIKVVCRRAMK